MPSKSIKSVKRTKGRASSAGGKSRLADTAAAIREFALGLPDTHEDFPWGERVIKVKKKVFVFLGKAEGAVEELGLSVKLPASGKAALKLPGTQPTGYGLGKSGWVSGSFSAATLPPVAELLRWVEESYCAVAPKKLVTQLRGLTRP